VSVLSVVNGWPTVVASLTTAAPLPVQLAGVLAVGLVGLTLLAALVGLAIGALPNPLAQANRLPERDAVQLGIAAGLAGAAAAASAGAIRTPVWARSPGLEALGTALPPLQQALEPVAGYLTRMTVLITVMVTLGRINGSWTRRGRESVVLEARRVPPDRHARRPRLPGGRSAIGPPPGRVDAGGARHLGR